MSHNIRTSVNCHRNNQLDKERRIEDSPVCALILHADRRKFGRFFVRDISTLVFKTNKLAPAPPNPSFVGKGSSAGTLTNTNKDKGG
jgi:hypothetical protein